MQPNGMMPPNGYQSMPVAGSQRKRHGLGVIITLVVFILLFIGSSIFALWAFSGRNDYKNNVDQKISQAVSEAKQQTAREKENEFQEKEKSPFKEYKGPSKFASVNITYPKTWAAYITETDKSGTPIDGFFHPVFVPGRDSGTNFALRVQVVNQSYDSELRQFDGKIKAGKVKISPYKSPRVPDVLGARIEGEIAVGQKATMVLFPVRDKTLKIFTESEQFLGDFNNTILPKLVFVP